MAGATYRKTYTIRRGAAYQVKLPGEFKPVVLYRRVSGVLTTGKGMVAVGEEPYSPAEWKISTVVGSLPAGITASFSGNFAYLGGTTNGAANRYKCVLTATCENGGVHYRPAVTWELTIDLTGAVVNNDNGGGSGTPEQPVVVQPPPLDTSSPVPISFRQARSMARSGSRIAQVSWADRWITFDRGLWYFTIINPITLVTVSTRVILMTDQSTEWHSSLWKVL